MDTILNEFSDYCKYFEETLKKDTNEDKQMYKEHKKQVQKLSKVASAEFADALSEAGII
jgi:hypothetical protein